MHERAATLRAACAFTSGRFSSSSALAVAALPSFEWSKATVLRALLAGSACRSGMAGAHSNCPSFMTEGSRRCGVELDATLTAAPQSSTRFFLRGNFTVS